MVGGVLDLNRPKGAYADVQGELRDIDSPESELVQESIREVEPRGRGSDRAWGLCIDGLVAFSVQLFVLPVDVGGEGHVAEPLQGLLNRQFRLQANDAPSRWRGVQDLHGQFR